MLTSDQRKAINQALAELADATSVAMYQASKQRTHLGASIIGEDCAAKVWYGFRWAKRGRFDGKQYRLFHTGHLYEGRFIELMTAMGFEMFPFAEDGSQYRITACEGHFGGSLDSGGIFRGLKTELLIDIITRQQYETLDNILAPLLNNKLLVEFKTHNQKNFDKLTKNGVRLSHRKHHTQFSTYGTFYELPHTLYLGYNKNTDEIHFELLANDTALCDDMVRKASEIITADQRPPRIAEDETFFECKRCSYAGICHRGEPMEKNCRSCRFAKAGPNRSWICTYWNNSPIPDDVIPQGCGQWAQIG